MSDQTLIQKLKYKLSLAGYSVHMDGDILQVFKQSGEVTKKEIRAYARGEFNKLHAIQKKTGRFAHVEVSNES